jgi:hypothetical protein
MEQNKSNNKLQSGNKGTHSFLKPVNLLFLNNPESEFSNYLEEAHLLVQREPLILRKIEVDVDHHGEAKKRIRILDKRWQSSQNGILPNFLIEESEISVNDLRLQEGHPRMDAYLVYMFLMIRGFLGGVKDSLFKMFLQESKTIELLSSYVNLSKMPGFSTISENINAVSNETRQFIFAAQIRLIMDEGFDDFKDLTVDSTSVSANSAWPTDSGIILGLVSRLFNRGKKFHKYGIADISDRRFPNIIKMSKQLHKEISLTVRKPKSKANRKKKYRKLLKESIKAHKAFCEELAKVKQLIIKVNILPSQYMKLEKLVYWMEEDLLALNNVNGYCSKRINKDESTPSNEKELSLSDKSVGFIKKGDREPVIGYKPQLGRSKKGFISAFKLPQGNASDSAELKNIVLDGISRTQVIPDIISADDGYSNKEIREYFLEEGVKIVSISGSKGKKIIGEEDWLSEDYVDARNNRSAVESLMFTIKYCFNFGRVTRRGIENVRAELLEKVLAYNFCRIFELRRKYPLELPLAA